MLGRQICIIINMAALIRVNSRDDHQGHCLAMKHCPRGSSIGFSGRLVKPTGNDQIIRASPLPAGRQARVRREMRDPSTSSIISRQATAGCGGWARVLAIDNRHCLLCIIILLPHIIARRSIVNNMVRDIRNQRPASGRVGEFWSVRGVVRTEKVEH
jgi:hypothetical protein